MEPVALHGSHSVGGQIVYQTQMVLALWANVDVPTGMILPFQPGHRTQQRVPMPMLLLIFCAPQPQRDDVAVRRQVIAGIRTCEEDHVALRNGDVGTDGQVCFHKQSALARLL